MDTWVEHYAGVEPGLRTRARLVEIEFLEVAASWRGRGIGRGVVGRLAKHYESEGECRLVAFSEGADAFWSSLGGSGTTMRKGRTGTDRCSSRLRDVSRRSS